MHSTTSHLGVTLKADVPDDDLRVESWVPIYPGADWHEREAWEMFGIEFVGHPHLAPHLPPGDFEGHPLRKDFPLIARMVKPWPGIVDVEPLPAGDDDEDAGRSGRDVMTVVADRRQLSYIAAQAADARVNVELETEDMTLNIGPQHPATHGTLRIIAKLDGEQVVSADPVMGYMHRGYEKLTEVRTFPQVTTLINRIDWLGSFANEVPFILAAEQLMEIEAPPRAQWIRTLLFELSRIANVTLFLGDMGVQLGALTPVFYAFRDREYVLNLIESVTGGRFHPNFDRIGGLKDDLPKGFDRRVQVGDGQDPCVLRRDGRAPRRQHDLPEPHPRHRRDPERHRPLVRRSPARTSARRASTGTCVATATCPWPGSTSTGRSGPIPTATRSPRYWVRLQEVREACSMVEQLLDGMPSGSIMAKVPRIIKVPAGEAWVSTENPLGEMGYYVVSKGDLGPFRVKIRSASFSNISITPWLLKGVYVPDVITILASLYFILGDIDR